MEKRLKRRMLMGVAIVALRVILLKRWSIVVEIT
jgi:hypothetical protein